MVPQLQLEHEAEQQARIFEQHRRWHGRWDFFVAVAAKGEDSRREAVVRASGLSTISIATAGRMLIVRVYGLG